MNYTETNNKNQIENNEFYLKFPSTLERFINTDTVLGKDTHGHDAYFFKGYATLTDEDRIMRM